MLSNAVISACVCLLLLILDCRGSKPDLSHSAVEDSVQIIEENKLLHASNPNAFVEVTRHKLVKPTGLADGDSTPKPSASTWEDQTLNKKLMEVKLEEKAKLKTNVNIYEGGGNSDVQNGDNSVGNIQHGTYTSGSPQSAPGASKSVPSSASALFQQIAAVSQMKNRFKSSVARNSTSDAASRGTSRPVRGSATLSSSIPETGKKGSVVKTKLRIVDTDKGERKSKPSTVEILGEKNLRQVIAGLKPNNNNNNNAMNQKKGSSDKRKSRTVDLLEPSTQPLYGVPSYSEVIPIKLWKRSIPSHGVKENVIRHRDSKKLKGKRQPHHRGVVGHGKHTAGRKRRAISTDFVSKRDKEADFVTSLKMSPPPPPILRVLPNEPPSYYHRSGRADEKQIAAHQSYDRDVQELIRHNVQHYVTSNNLDVTPNGHNDFLSRLESPSRHGNQRRIIYYATLPEIVRRPNMLSLHESPYWTNYMVPRELSGSSNQANNEVKVHSTMLDVRDSTNTLIPIKTISPHQASGNSMSRSDKTIQPAPYYADGYPMRHNRYPPPEPPLPPLRPINYDLAMSNNPITNHPSMTYANIIPNVIPKQLEIHSPKSYEVNGKRYGIYDIPTLGDNSLKPLYDEGRYENNKFSNYEKFYSAPGTFDKHVDYYESSSGDLDSDLDWSLGPLGATSKSSYSLKYVPQSVTYLPRSFVKTLDPASSSSFKQDVVGKHSSNVVHSVTVETSSGNTNGTLDGPTVQVNEKNSTVMYEKHVNS